MGQYEGCVVSLDAMSERGGRGGRGGIGGGIKYLLLISPYMSIHLLIIFSYYRIASDIISVLQFSLGCY